VIGITVTRSRLQLQPRLGWWHAKDRRLGEMVLRDEASWRTIVGFHIQPRSLKGPLDDRPYRSRYWVRFR